MHFKFTVLWNVTPCPLVDSSQESASLSVTSQILFCHNLKLIDRRCCRNCVILWSSYARAVQPAHKMITVLHRSCNNDGQLTLSYGKKGFVKWQIKMQNL